MVWQTALRALSAPSEVTTCLNSWRSSPRRIASTSAPIELDPVALQHAARVQRHRGVERRLPAERRQQRVRPLLLDDRVTYSGVIGSRYVASANSGSVMIVAGLELMRVTRRPSSRSTRQACVPE